MELNCVKFFYKENYFHLLHLLRIDSLSCSDKLSYKSILRLRTTSFIFFTNIRDKYNLLSKDRCITPYKERYSVRNQTINDCFKMYKLVMGYWNRTHDSESLPCIATPASIPAT